MPTAQAHDSVQTVRRFHKRAEVAERDGPEGAAWAVLLDGRTARTPAAAPLVLPTRALAQLSAAEWDAQGEFLRFATMPVTRLAFTAIDLVPEHRAAVAAEAARYTGSDLLCYFAEQPDALVRRQAEQWGPILDWAESALGLRLERTAGIIHCPQPPDTLARAQELAEGLDDFALSGLAFAAPLFGSLVLAAAVVHGRLTGEAALKLSRLDETFQEETWGIDAEAAERVEVLRTEAVALDRWFRALET